MAVKFTSEQLKVIKQMVIFSENFADQIWKIMTDHQLDKVEGCSLRISVDPQYNLARNSVIFGTKDKDAGHVTLVKGDLDNENYKVIGHISLEYEILFADKELRERILDNLKDEPPLPPDGLWLSACDDDPDVDSRV